MGGILIKGTSSDALSNPWIADQNGFVNPDQATTSLIGIYGDWASKLLKGDLPELSYRRKEWSKVETWCNAAKRRTMERLAIPDIGGLPEVKINKHSRTTLNHF